jgi:hypothetical protein
MNLAVMVLQIPICAAEPILAHHSRAMRPIALRKIADDAWLGEIRKRPLNRLTGTGNHQDPGVRTL